MVFAQPNLRYSTLVESSPAVMITTGSDGIIQFANAGTERMLGYRPAELVGQSIEVLVPTSLRKRHGALRQSFLADPSDRMLGGGRDLPAVRRDGTEITVEIALTPIETETGLFILATLIDVTERKRTEQGLRQRAAELGAAVQGAVNGIVTIDETGTMQSVNPAAAKLFGYDAAELVGKNVNILMPEPYHSEHDAYLRRYLRTGRAKIIGVGREVEGQRRDGSVFPMELGVSAVVAGGKRFFVGFVHDLGERRRIEARLQKLHADRLNAIGGMAAAVAHEINQPLSASATYLETARRLLRRPRELRPANIENVLEAAAEQIMRAGRIISNLREFVARGEPDKTFQNLHELIRNVHELMVAKVKEDDVQFVLRLNAKDDRVLVDPIQIKQVIVNLTRNALEAMHDCARRELTVTTSLAERLIRTDVADTGAGLPQEIRTNPFEPFVGKKTKGMGIGLSISRSIVEAHHGSIWAEVNPEGGAVFSFSLPLVDRKAHRANGGRTKKR